MCVTVRGRRECVCESEKSVRESERRVCVRDREECVREKERHSYDVRCHRDLSGVSVRETKALACTLGHEPVRETPTTRWTTDLPLKVNLPRVINFKASCGAHLITLPPEFWGNESFVVHRVVLVPI